MSIPTKIQSLRWLMRLALFACLTACGADVCAADRMLQNGAMEDAAPGKLPAHWEPLSIGTAATIVTDEKEKHAGRSSVRIEAAEPTRSYVCSTTMPVAPGEEIAGSAWVKVRDMPADHGACIMMAEFFTRGGTQLKVEKFDVANVAKASKDWEKISGTVKVPDEAASMRLRLGFSYAKGTCWWDDVTLTPKSQLALRIDLPEPRLSPAMEALPVMVLNRSGAKQDVRVVVNLKSQTAEKRLALSGEATQLVEVPIKLPGPGKLTAKAEMFAARGEKPIFSAEVPGIVPPPIVLPPVSPTHWVVEDGPPKIEGRIDLAVSDARRKGATLNVEVRDSTGKTVASWTSGAGTIADGFNDFTIDAKGVGLGEYTIVGQLAPREGKAISAEQPWHVIPRSRAKVTINSGGYPQYDGKAILPLGIFNGAKFKEQGEAGFTVTHAYNAVRLEEGGRNSDQQALNYLDNTGLNGMKMLFMVPMKVVIAGDWDLVRRRVRMFRNHPALLAWDEEEGFGRGDFKPDTLKTLRKLLMEEDPNHPFMVGDPRDIITRVRGKADFFPVSEMDMGMWWWYPFPLKARPADALQGEEASAGDLLEPPSFLTTAKTDNKPLWVGVQSYKKDAKSRYPTPEEYRCQAYLGFVAGAKGLMWYGGSVTGGLFLAPEEGHWDALKKVAREVSDLSPVFLSKTLEAPKVSPVNATVSVILKQAGERIVLIAANRSLKAADVTISSPALSAGDVLVMHENRNVKTSSGSIADHFGPLAVHVYEVK